MPKTDNRSMGNQFETELGSTLAEHGFWVHLMQQNKSGQPADIIAVKGKYHTLIDCKLISDHKGFPFERVEENQKYAMRMFHKKSGEMCWFAMKLPDETVWLIPMERVEVLVGRGKNKLSELEIKQQTWPLEKWLKDSEEWAKDI